MNTEDSEFERIEREAKLRQVPLQAKIYDYEEAYLALKAMRGVPDPIHHTDPGESLEYITGWNDCRQAVLSQQALDKMAENAKELGLDYEPAQQEPFGYFKAEPFGWTDCAETDEGAVALYTTPQAPAEQPAREPLTDEQISAASKGHMTRNGFARAIEAAHGIKEKT